MLAPDPAAGSRAGNPEDERFWARSRKYLARRNLLLSLFSEHLGFSVWSIWSVLVLFLSSAIGFPFDPGQKFLLVSVPTLVGSVLRLPYSYAVTRFGGRTGRPRRRQGWALGQLRGDRVLFSAAGSSDDTALADVRSAASAGTKPPFPDN